MYIQQSELGKRLPEQFSAPDVSLMIKNQIQNEFRLTRPETQLKLDKTMLFLAAKGYGESLRHIGFPPQYIVHQWQVAAVSENLVAWDQGLREEANRHAKLHDSGRAYNMNSLHPQLGRMVIEALGYPPGSPYAVFAEAHDKWGAAGKVGERFMPAITEFIAMHRRTPDFFNRVLDGDFEYRLKDIFDGMYEMYLSEFGLPGIATLIADNSKIRRFKESTDPYAQHLTIIHPFSRPLAKELIDDQILKGSYRNDPNRYETEVVTSQFLLYAIQRMEQETGTHYVGAVENASKEWDDFRFVQLLTLWEETMEQLGMNDVKRIAHPVPIRLPPNELTATSQ